VILSPTGKDVKECKNEKEYLRSYLLAGPQDTVLYALANGEIVTLKADCTTLWRSSVRKKGAGLYTLAFDGDQTVYVGGSGCLYALNAGDGKQLWNRLLDSTVGNIESIVVAKDGLIYAVSTRGRLLAFDRQGKQIWLQDLYEAGMPRMLQSAPNGDLVMVHAGQLLVYTRDASLAYQLPTPVPPPFNRQQAEDEITSFLVDFVVVHEIGGTAEYIRTSGQPWVDAPPEANIIIYAPPKDTSVGSSYLDTEKPIQVWWYANNQLTEVEVEDKLKAIEEYRNRYMKDSSSGIWAWGYYEVGILSISADYQSAEVYVGASCGGLCGHGYRYSLQRSASGKWWIFDGVHLWQA
jgi:hypothetical protein